MPYVKKIRNGLEARTYCSQMHWRRRQDEENGCCPALLIADIESPVKEKEYGFEGHVSSYVTSRKRNGWLSP